MIMTIPIARGIVRNFCNGRLTINVALVEAVVMVLTVVRRIPLLSTVVVLTCFASHMNPLVNYSSLVVVVWNTSMT